VTKYIPQHKVKNIRYKKLYTIKPSKRLGTPMEFVKPSFEEKYQLGYEDAMRVLERINQ